MSNNVNDEIVEDQATTEGWHQITSILYFIAVVIMLIILIFHTIKFFQDLCTPERKSLSHRRNEPKLTKPYKIITVFIEISVIFWTAAILSSVVSFFLTNKLQCDISKTFVLSSIQIAKTCMYLVYLTRIYRIYEKSIFSYPLKCIWFFIIFIILYGIGALIIIIMATNVQLFEYANGDAYPNWCASDGDALYQIMGVILFFEDIGVGIGFATATLIPLRKTLHAIKKGEYKDKKTAKISRKIAYIATKTTILVIVQTLSTLILGILVITTGIGLIYAPDSIINSCCIIFISGYYPNKTYYERWCKLCILCCGKKVAELTDSQEYEDIGNDNNDESTTKQSVDTRSALRVIGEQVSIKYTKIHDDTDNDNDDKHDNTVNDLQMVQTQEEQP